MKKKKQVVDQKTQRFGLFMTQESFDLEVEYGRHFLKTDNVQYVYIHKVNIIETKTHSLYGQAKPKDKKYMSAVQINVMVNVSNSEQAYYGNIPAGVTRQDSGKIDFGVYLKELKEKNLEIDRGDIIEYNLSGEKKRYYEVEDADLVTDTTSHTIGGFQKYFRHITGVPAKEDIIPFLNETQGDFI